MNTSLPYTYYVAPSKDVGISGRLYAVAYPLTHPRESVAPNRVAVGQKQPLRYSWTKRKAICQCTSKFAL